MNDTIIGAVRDWLAGYPGFRGGRIAVDFLAPEAASYSVDATPIQSVVKQYMDGSSIRQFAFVFAARAPWGADTRQQIENAGFFEDLAAWLEQKSKARELPDLGAGRRSQKLEVTASGYLFAPETELARYQMQCKLTYYQQGGK